MSKLDKASPLKGQFADFSPMLAGKVVDIDTLTYPLLASPKLDGIRCVVLQGKALTRKLKPIPNTYIRTYLERKEFEGLDGELIVGKTFQSTTSAVMSHDGRPKFRFHVFDFLRNETPNWGFLDRITTLHRYAGLLRDEHLVSVEHVNIASPRALERYEELCLADGYEGVMVRSTNGLYKFGRSTTREGWLLKLKRFEDDEAKIIGYEEQYHNANEAFRDEVGNLKRSSAREGLIGKGVLGAFVVKYGSIEFRVGTGYTEQQRRKFWKLRKQMIGQWLKFRSQPFGVKDKPRLPTFLGIRDEADM